MILASSSSSTLPLPFSRVLRPQQPPLTGPDVYVLQNLLRNAQPELQITSAFDQATSAALCHFQSVAAPDAPCGVLEESTAAAVLSSTLVRDHYRWDGRPLPAPYRYLIHIRTWANRSRESNATLYDAKLLPLLRFPARLHGVPAGEGADDDRCYSNDAGRNMFSPNGDTPTGLSELDLNSPEDNATVYGPWPINRVVRGVKGNAAWLLTGRTDGSNVRSGILVHTGAWNETCAWAPPHPMPNSFGCVHVWPENIRSIFELLTQQLRVDIRPNTNGLLPYPYEPQGLISIEQLDG
jgi:hypothetical protein